MFIADRKKSVVRSNSLRSKLRIVYGPNRNSVGPVWASNSGAPGYTVQYSADAVLTGLPWGVVERPADDLSSPPATLTEAPEVSPPLSVDALSLRQREVLYLIVQGKTNREIARSLVNMFIWEKDVERS